MPPELDHGGQFAALLERLRMAAAVASSTLHMVQTSAPELQSATMQTWPRQGSLKPCRDRSPL
jgi:hypothetical protein